MVDRYKPTEGEVKQILTEVINPLPTEKTVLRDDQDKPTATIVDMPTADTTVLIDHDSGMTYTEKYEPEQRR